MTRPGICFGYRTALQILRVTGTDKLVRAKSQDAVLSNRSPSVQEVAEAVMLLERAYPASRIESPVHIVVGDSSRCRFTETCRPHCCSVPLSSGSFYQLGPGLFVEAPPLAYVRMATQVRDKIALLELGYELVGTYRTQRTAASSAYQVPPLASVRALREYAERNASVNGARKVLEIVRYLADGSASARETKQALVLGLPHKYGGAGLGMPRMNFEVKTTREARAMTGKGSFRCDLCWPEAKLDVEYQSKEWHEGDSCRVRDSRRTNALIAMGWTVVGITGDELDSLVATDVIAGSLRKRLGLHTQIRVADYHARKLKLRRQLGLPVGYD